MKLGSLALLACAYLRRPRVAAQLVAGLAVVLALVAVAVLLGLVVLMLLRR